MRRLTFAASALVLVFLAPLASAEYLPGPWDDNCQGTVDTMCRDQYGGFWDDHCVVYTYTGPSHREFWADLGVCMRG